MEFIIAEYIQRAPDGAAPPGDESMTSKPGGAMRSTDVRLSRRSRVSSCERLSEGIGTIAAAFYPKPVVVRMSDFKTNEYATLVGGAAFEPEESNPMLGFRGASRYAHPAYAEGFELECAGDEARAGTDGPDERRPHDPVRRRVAEADLVLAEHGQIWSAARRERAQGVRRCARSRTTCC